MKKVLITLAGAAVGAVAGFIAAFSMVTPQGTLKFTSASQKMSRLDIKPLGELKEFAKPLNATRM